ncbi:putative anti-sigma-YlaC factor YlaD [Mycobacterium sp. MAA66]|uniref:zf-HC2 domain-containing protein n=1 Tax=Mycobacterium sp. MAA66 TaxID=3156297 RepID=UPI003517E2D7
MECEIAREALSARMDGEREPVPTGRVDEHLASCPDCRRWQAQMESQMQLLRGLATTDRTRMTAVSDTVHAPIQRRRPWARVARIGLTLAAASVLALGLGLAVDRPFGWPVAAAVLVAVTAGVLWRIRSAGGTRSADPVEVDDITLPDNASRGRRRGHLWPTDGAA